MFPGMDDRSVKAAMRKMGIQQTELAATEVIIKTPDKRLVIKNPSIVKINMMGEEVLQVSGAITEEDAISEEDIKTVAEQAQVSESDARAAIKETGDLALAIIKLKDAK